MKTVWPEVCSFIHASMPRQSSPIARSAASNMASCSGNAAAGGGREIGERRADRGEGDELRRAFQAGRQPLIGAPVAVEPGAGAKRQGCPPPGPRTIAIPDRTWLKNVEASTTTATAATSAQIVRSSLRSVSGSAGSAVMVSPGPSLADRD